MKVSTKVLGMALASVITFSVVGTSEAINIVPLPGKTRIGSVTRNIVPQLKDRDIKRPRLLPNGRAEITNRRVSTHQKCSKYLKRVSEKKAVVAHHLREYENAQNDPNSNAAVRFLWKTNLALAKNSLRKAEILLNRNCKSLISSKRVYKRPVFPR
jgi:hypothetical protein